MHEARQERLHLLVEEMGESLQAIGKVLRHGYHVGHPEGGPTNRAWLEQELGDVLFSIELLCDCGDLSPSEIQAWRDRKRGTVQAYIHYNVVTRTGDGWRWSP